MYTLLSEFPNKKRIYIYIYIHMYDYKVSDRTLGPCRSGSTTKRRFWTPTAKIRRITISTLQKLSFEVGFRPQRQLDSLWRFQNLFVSHVFGNC